jgi:subfamily B ATP-binding cassette protein MsbA
VKFQSQADHNGLALLRRVISQLGPYRRRIVLMAGSMVLGVLLTLPLPIIIQLLIDRVLRNHEVYLLHWLVAALVLLLFVKGAVGWYQTHLYTYVGYHATADLSKRGFKHVLQLPLDYFTQARMGVVQTKLTVDANNMRDVMASALPNILTDALTVAVLLVILFNYSIPLTLCSVITVPILFYMLRRVNVYVTNHTDAVQKSWAAAIDRLQELLSAVRLIKAFAQEGLASRWFGSAIDQNVQSNIRLQNLRASTSQLIGLISMVGPVVVLWYGGLLVINGKLSIGQFVAYYSFLGMLIPPIGRLAQLTVAVQIAMVSAGRIFELLDLPAEDLESGALLDEITPTVKFEHVSFAYGERGETAFRLDDVSFEVRPGEVLAIMGESGAGKTTLVNLLHRFYEPQSGRILIDGADIRRQNLSELRRAIGCVSHEDFVFNTTLLENIQFGAPEASFDEIIEASKAAGLHDFVQTLPDGYQTLVGDKGTRLSGGQRQRISIARAILKDPRILILDEATSALDSQTESIIHEALSLLSADRTVILISHRLSSVLHAHHIVVLESGRVVESGGYDHLVGCKGRLYELCKKQFLTISG